MRFSYATLDDLHRSISDKVQAENNDLQIDFKNSIEIKNLSFSYKNNEKNVLNNINLKINSGDKIAIIGSTGCGKSTLLDVLSGLIPACEGELFVDGISLNEYNSKSYRRIVFDEICANFLTISKFRNRVRKKRPNKFFKGEYSKIIINNLPFKLTKSQKLVMNEINEDKN